MSTSVLTPDSAIPISLVGDTFEVPAEAPKLPGDLAGIFLEVNLPTLKFRFGAHMVAYDSASNANEVVIRSRLDPDGELVLRLEGDRVDTSTFRVNYTWLELNGIGANNRVDFLGGLLWAAIGLEDDVEVVVPEFHIATTLKPTITIRDIAAFLVRGQTAGKLLTVERATNSRIRLPNKILWKDRDEIELAYQAITNRAFDWPTNVIERPIPISQNDMIQMLLAGGLARDFRLSVEQFEVSILNHSIALGPCDITLAEARLIGASLDTGFLSGKPPSSSVTLQSLTGVAHYTFHSPPIAPVVDDQLEIATWQLKAVLDSRLASRYQRLAVATLEGLTDEERNELLVHDEDEAELTDAE